MEIEKVKNLHIGIKSFWKIGINVMKGFLIGAANVIPGVSGSTIALVVGVFEKLVNAINAVSIALFTSFLGFLLKPKENKERFFENIRLIDLGFLIPLGIGILLAVFLLSSIIPNAMDRFPAQSYALFAGLIIGSMTLLFPKIMENKKPKHSIVMIFLSFVLGVLICYTLVGLKQISASHSYLILFVSGFLAITGTILPGISGSFILLILGQYKFFFESLRMIKERFFELLFFGIGILVGLKATAFLIELLLKKFRPHTLAFLTGLMIGSLRLSYDKIYETISLTNDTFVVAMIAIGFVILGFFVVVIFERLSRKHIALVKSED
jgi:putative membrane protein